MQIINIALTMRMNDDQKGRAGKMVAVPSALVAPALFGALCVGVGRCKYSSTIGV